MELKLPIDDLSETLLWDSVVQRIEEIQEVRKMVSDIDYIEELDKLLTLITDSEILMSDGIFVDSNQSLGNDVILDFNMPFVLIASIKGEQILRITANVVGNCTLLNVKDSFWFKTKWTSLSKSEIVSFGNHIKFNKLSYSDCECDDLRFN